MGNNWYDKFYKNTTKAQVKNQRKQDRKELEEEKEVRRQEQKKQAGEGNSSEKGRKPAFRRDGNIKSSYFSGKTDFQVDGKVLSITKMFRNENLPADSKKVLDSFDQIVQSASPLNSRQILNLPKSINALSHSLTDERENRRIGYMNSVEQLSAYIRYFTWWNIVRLTKVFSAMPSENFNLNDGDFCADFGSGPLTVVIALWLSRPELRNKKLTWYCVDISSGAMALGENIFLSIAAKCPPSEKNAEANWNIVRVKGETGVSLRNKVRFITCANMFNEITQKSDKSYDAIARSYCETLVNYGTEDCRFFVAEPGVPNSAHFVSLVRDEFIEKGKNILSPCSHKKKCCMNGKHAKMGGKAKWCNFAFSTEDAPSALLKLSEQANLPKERAVISFVFAGDSNACCEKSKLLLRVASDSFWLPGNVAGFYACSEAGLVLIINQSKKNIESGDLILVDLNKNTDKLFIDEKSGAKKIIL